VIDAFDYFMGEIGENINLYLPKYFPERVRVIIATSSASKNFEHFQK